VFNTNRHGSTKDCAVSMTAPIGQQKKLKVRSATM